ncbi:hypothetical protein D3C85_1560270 [compost metagenome]
MSRGFSGVRITTFVGVYGMITKVFDVCLVESIDAVMERKNGQVIDSFMGVKSPGAEKEGSAT